MLRIAVVGTAISLALSRLLHYVAERPFLRLATNNTTGKNVTSFGDVERLLGEKNGKIK